MFDRGTPPEPMILVRRFLPAGTTLHYDQVPLEDFLACLTQYETDVRTGFLPPARNLKGGTLPVRLERRARGREGHWPLYLLQETDALSQQTESFSCTLRAE